MPAELAEEQTQSELEAGNNENDGSTAQSEDENVGGDPLEGDETLQSVVKDLIKHFSGQEKFSRRQEIIETRQQRFYWRNAQHVYWDLRLWAFIQAVAGATVGTGSDAVTMPDYLDSYNIYTPYGESLIAPLISNPPGVNFEADDPRNPSDISSAEAAEKYKQKIDRDNQLKELQKEVARLFYTDGRVILYSRPVKDEQELGTDETGEPNSKVLITAHGVLESKVVPLTAKSRAELVAAYIADEMEINIAKETYKSAATKIIEGPSSMGETSYERIARLGVLQGTRFMNQAADALKHLVTRHRVWLRPSGFNKAPEEYRQILKDKYPEGGKFVLVGDAWCTSKVESMDDHLSIGHATPGDGMSRPSLGHRMIPLQDAFNDGMNMLRSANDQCVPQTYAHEDAIDIDALREQVAEPGTVVPVKLPPGLQSIADAFYEQASQGIPVSLTAALEMIEGPLAQFISGALPSLIGEADTDNKTKGGIQMLRDQAMGRMALPWGSIQEMYATAYRQATLCAVEAAEEGATFTFVRKNRRGKSMGTEEIAYSELRKGNFRCHPDMDSTFPETSNAKRATFMTLMNGAENNPILAENMSQPDNQEMGHELLGLPDLVIVGAEARNKQLDEIQRLLKESPIYPTPPMIEAAVQQNPALMGPAQKYAMLLAEVKATSNPEAPLPLPVPPRELWPLCKPTIDVEEDDFHKYEDQECQDWLSSDECRQQERQGNYAGVLNVRLHRRLHQAANQAEQAQAAAAAGKGKSGPGESLNFKDLPPKGQIQLAKQAGIELSPEDVGIMPPPGVGAAAPVQQGAPAQ